MYAFEFHRPRSVHEAAALLSQSHGKLVAGGQSLVAALKLAARCGAACLTGRGPYEGQLRRA